MTATKPKKKSPTKKQQLAGATPRKIAYSKQDIMSIIRVVSNNCLGFLKAHWIGTVLLLAATLIFFWPLVIRMDSYSPGGDAMFNAWTLARDQHCILGQGCPNYDNANIYFPHKDTMLYSETQLSAGFITLPLYAIDHNPLFSFNVLTILSFFLSGWFMYMLVKRLSKGNEPLSILAGLIFEFAPFKMAAVWHLQNLSIFCLPLIILCVLKFFEYRQKKYLWALFFVLLYQFYASWYQMVFVLIAIGTLLLAMKLFRLVPWKPTLMIGGVVVLALVATLPLAKEYIRFSKSNKATFSVTDQALYSSSVADYVTPYSKTISGQIYHKLDPTGHQDSYNLDSYSYQGFVLYFVAIGVVITAFIMRKRNKESQRDFRTIMSLAAVGIVGLLLSFGPLLKVKDSYLYGHVVNGAGIAIAMPYLLVDKFLPQLSFIRAIGRISVLLLVVLCCFLAYVALWLRRSSLSTVQKRIATAALIFLVFVDIMPIKTLALVSNNPYAFNIGIPKAYEYIKQHKEVDGIIVLQATNYPGVAYEFARPEVTLWTGYTNKNFFNGYSGYTPPTYFEDYADFVNFEASDVPKLQAAHLRYVLVDKLLMKSKPEAVSNVYSTLHDKVYEDSRYALFKI
jgi:hypothetical protein